MSFNGTKIRFPFNKLTDRWQENRDVSYSSPISYYEMRSISTFSSNVALNSFKLGLQWFSASKQAVKTSWFVGRLMDVLKC